MSSAFSRGRDGSAGPEDSSAWPRRARQEELLPKGEAGNRVRDEVM
jgi:hypothetical protein